MIGFSVVFRRCFSGVRKPTLFKEEHVSKIKSLSRAAWVVVGLVAAVLLVPTVAVAATVAYNGIEGTNGTTTTQNKALVTSAGQLLTTPVQPSKYEDYSVTIDTTGGQNGGEECLGAVRIPSGDSFIAEQVHVSVLQTNASSSTNSGGYTINSTGDVFELVADNPSQTDCQGDIATLGTPPGGLVGNIDISLTPGYVFPSGYGVDAYVAGMAAFVYVTGYLVPSADAPSTPTNSSQYALPRH
jgi:hypothetical protein